MDILLIAILIAGFYMAWNIGANDTANSVGTSVGSGVLSLRGAIIRVCIFDMLGALLMGKYVTKTIGKGIVNIDAIGDIHIITIGALAAILGAGIWVTIATLMRLPVSTTHSIVGAMLGFGLVAGGIEHINWNVLVRIASSWIVSPLVGALMSFIIFSMIRSFVLKKADNIRKTEKVFGYLQVFTAMYVGFSIGANDVANAIGPLYLVLTMKGAVVDPLWILAFGGLGIAAGMLTWGYKVIDTIGKRVTEITPTRGFSAEFATASVVLVNTYIGMPISTTHTLVGAVIGVGFARGIKALNIRIIYTMLISWVVTVPLTAIFSMVIFLLVRAWLGV
ncbi:MAG: inorganic phosphate transporter [Candidatus Hydrothermarchaeota archaeon]|nr:inorganic phosphate transporter [Candidatus Hydrothermarchaeota archaeon]